MERVVITGAGVVSPCGRGVDALYDGLFGMRSTVRPTPAELAVEGVDSALASLVPELDTREIPRKQRRFMSPMSLFATLAGVDALRQARLEDDRDAVALALGSTTGSTAANEEFFRSFLPARDTAELKSTHFFRIMNHSCAGNVAGALGLTGRILAPASACATATQALGLAYELIAAGRERICLCGGAEEYHGLATAVFDVMGTATRKWNDRPTATPRPFDRDRDGIVCGEGAGLLVLEAASSARARGVPVLGEVIGFATSGGGVGLAAPDADGMARCMQRAMQDAGISPGDVDLINAHATGTISGDQAEAQAIQRVFGDQTPVNSLKGHLGHAMAACGAFETVALLEMMRRGTAVATRNLEHVDPACAGVRHLQENASLSLHVVAKNSFALGGINATLIIRDHSP